MWSKKLKIFWKAINRDRLLLLVLFFGLVLRGSNPTFGSPSLFVSNDEAIAHLSALNMIAEKTGVSISNYTPFGAYMQIPFIMFVFLLLLITGTITSVSGFELLILTNEGYLLFIPRIVSAFFGVLTVLFLYKLTYTLFFNNKIALISAFLGAYFVL